MNTSGRIATLEAALRDRRRERAALDEPTEWERDTEQRVLDAEKTILAATDVGSLDAAKREAETARRAYGRAVEMRQYDTANADTNVRACEAAIETARDEERRDRLHRFADLERYYRKPTEHRWAVLVKAREELGKLGVRFEPLEDGHRLWPTLRGELASDPDRAARTLRQLWPGFFSPRFSGPAIARGCEMPPSASPFQLLAVRFGSREEREQVFADFERARVASLPVHVVGSTAAGLRWSDGAVTSHNVVLASRNLPMRPGDLASTCITTAADESQRQACRVDLARPEPEAEPEPDIDLDAEEDDDDDEHDAGTDTDEDPGTIERAACAL